MARIAYPVKQIGIGTSDYSPIKPPGQVTPGAIYTLADMGELAARLGSINTFDRRGNVIFLEDFEGSLAKLYTGSEGTGGSVAISNERSRHGDFSAKMISGDTNGECAYVGLDVAYPVLSKIGAEICWALPFSSNIGVVDLSIDLFDGTMDYYAWVKWQSSNSTWYYYNGAAWVALSPTVEYYQGDTQFNHIKLVADFVNKKYVRLIANDHVYDLSDIALPSEAKPYNAFLEIEVCNYTNTDAVCTMYLDSVIITQNEP